MTEAQKDTLAQAVLLFGETSQINMAIEEAGELITALAKRDRNRNGSSITQILEEMADVHIMLHQLILIFDEKNHLCQCALDTVSFLVALAVI